MDNLIEGIFGLVVLALVVIVFSRAAFEVYSILLSALSRGLG